MSDLWGNLIGVLIVILLVLFLAIWFWAWRPRHKASFQRMAQMPLEDNAHSPEQKSPTAGRDEA